MFIWEAFKTLYTATVTMTTGFKRERVTIATKKQYFSFG